ncbi:MAG: PAS domain S-box protein [Sphingomicrobium sp.]
MMFNRPSLRDRSKKSAHLAEIVRSSTDAIISKSLEGKIISWNAAAERIFGYSATEMIGQSIRRLIPLELQGEEDEILERLRAGEIITKFETVRLHRDGRLVPIALTVSPIRGPDGAIVGASKIAHDLSGEQAVRTEHRDRDVRFRMLADNMDQLAWIGNSAGALYWYNQRWYDYTGTDFDTMQGWGWQKVQHPDHVDRVNTLWAKALAKGEGWEDTFPLRAADGSYRWFLSRAHPIRDDTGTITHWFGTNTDITDRREYEERIRLLLGECNHRAKNMLTMIQAVVHRTATSDPDLVERLSQRIGALGANQDLLIQREWVGAPIRDLITSHLAFAEDVLGHRVTLDGPPLDLLPRAAETIGLAIHELTTNACKYGALSTDKGAVAIAWSVEGDRKGKDAAFHLEWIESGGPPVEPPKRSGFGTMLIKRNPARALKAQVDCEYSADGFRWSLDSPLSSVSTIGQTNLDE